MVGTSPRRGGVAIEVVPRVLDTTDHRCMYVVPGGKTVVMVRTETRNGETVAVAVLMGFSTRPTDDVAAHELYRHCEAATFALTREDLPYGCWARQGYAFERAATIAVRRTAALALCRQSGRGRVRQW